MFEEARQPSGWYLSTRPIQHFVQMCFSTSLPFCLLGIRFCIVRQRQTGGTERACALVAT
jgi:hypothetical protein